MAARKTAFAEFIFDLIDTSQNYNEPKSLISDIMSYKERKQADEQMQGFLCLSDAIQGPDIFDLLFPEDFSKHFHRDKIRNFFNDREGSANPPLHAKSVYRYMNKFFLAATAPSTACFLENCSKIMHGSQHLLGMIPPEKHSEFYGFVIKRFQDIFSDHCLLPADIYDTFIANTDQLAGSAPAKAPSSVSFTVCEMLVLILFYMFGEGEPAQDSRLKFFSLLTANWNTAPRVTRRPEKLDSGDSFQSSLFQGLFSEEKAFRDEKSENERKRVRSLDFSSNHVIIGDGGSGKTIFLKKLNDTLESKENCIDYFDCYSNASAHASIKLMQQPECIFLKLKSLPRGSSFCKYFYDVRDAYLSDALVRSDEAPSTPQEAENWFTSLINRKVKKRIVFLLDGFNEINRDQRKNLIREIQNVSSFIDAKWRPCFVLTCRPEYERFLPPDIFPEENRLFIHKLESNTIVNYLQKTSDSLKSYYDTLSQMQQQNLCDVLSSPLLLSFFGSTYKDLPTKQIPAALSRPHVFDDACEKFVQNLSQERQPYGKLCYKFLLPEMLSDWTPSAGFDAGDAAIADFSSLWLENYRKNKNNRFWKDSQIDALLLSMDKDEYRDGFRIVLGQLVDYLCQGQGALHDTVLAFFAAKSVMNECLYSTIPFQRSKFYELIDFSIGYHIDTALDNWQKALLFAEIFASAAEPAAVPDPKDSLPSELETACRQHWPEFLFALVNYIDTLREDSSLLLKYFFMLEPCCEIRDEKKHFRLRQIDTFTEQCCGKDYPYCKSMIYNSLAYILNRMADEELGAIYADNLKALGFCSLQDFKNGMTESFLKTASKYIKEYILADSFSSLEKHKQSMARLLDAKIESNWGAYYLRRYSAGKNNPDSDDYDKVIRFQNLAKKKKEELLHSFYQAFENKSDFCTLKTDCKICTNQKNGTGYHPDCEDYRRVLSSLSDSYTAIATRSYYRANRCMKAEPKRYSEALKEYSAAIRNHETAEAIYKVAEHAEVSLVNRLRKIGCQIEQIKLCIGSKTEPGYTPDPAVDPDFFTGSCQDPQSIIEQNLGDILREMILLLDKNEQIRRGVERQTVKNNFKGIEALYASEKLNISKEQTPQLDLSYKRLSTLYKSNCEKFFAPDPKDSANKQEAKDEMNKKKIKKTIKKK